MGLSAGQSDNSAPVNIKFPPSFREAYEKGPLNLKKKKNSAKI